VREALKLLEAEGLVELRPNRSARVAPLKRSEIRDLFEAVGGIERLAAELAAVRITPGELRRLHVMQRRMERLHERGDLRGYFEVNQQIHGFVVACGGNRTLAATHDWLLARVERARFFALSARGRWDESVVEHRAILAALEGRDPAAAGRALSAHVQRTGAVVVEILRATHATPDPPP
jgi:DNA-binding GntR family transcriptional regulator